MITCLAKLQTSVAFLVYGNTFFYGKLQVNIVILSYIQFWYRYRIHR